MATARAVLVLSLLAAAALGAGAPAAQAAPATKIVAYHGYRLTVPSAWPVFRLATAPATCVRFDRHAVYLGAPGAGAAAECPAQPAGRTEAILLTPLTHRSAQPPTAEAPPTVPAADAPGGSIARFVDTAHHVVVTATWRTDPAVVRRALGVRSLARLAQRSRQRPRPYTPRPTRAARAPRAVARTATLLPAPGQPFTGPGFDACSTPSLQAMAAWAGDYQAAGVYIGGANMACAQPNLTGAWVSAVAAAGWHLIPIYVGLQAPANSCSCAAISKTGAATQGAAAAIDAVAQAQARGLGPGNPVYFDMEAYRRTDANTAAVLTFLSAWTTQLHEEGYLSGVYSSDGSGIADLVAANAEPNPEPNPQPNPQPTYAEPDDLWVANWNGAPTTDDAYIPATAWADHQRLHQYAGDHNETHGGVKLNIDGDWVDAATAAPGSAPLAGGAVAAAAPPQTNGAPAITGTPVAGETLTELHAAWSAAPTAYTYLWQACDTTGQNCAPIPGATGQTLTLAGAQVGETIEVTETAANPLGVSAPVTSAPTAPVLAAPGAGYWLLTAGGRVYNSAEMAWYGSGIHTGARSFTGMAATADGQGYWLVNRGGRTFAFGDATQAAQAAQAAPPRQSPSHPVIGIVADPAGGGYWIYTAQGNVHSGAGAPWYGSAVRARDTTITGMAATTDGQGYWLVDRGGRTFAYGDAAQPRPLKRTPPVIGIVANPSGAGYWLYTARGNVYAEAGAPGYGSAARLHLTTITGMTATADGHGYWLVDRGGRTYAYGDATLLPRVPTGGHPVIEIGR